MKALAIMTTVGVVAALTACRGEANKSAASARLVLSAPSPKPPGKMTVTLTLENTGPVALWINKRMVTGRWSADQFHEVWFDVTGPSGEAEVYGCPPGRIGWAEKDDYLVLRVGEKKDFEVQLRCFDFARLGRYTLVAHYQDGNDRLPPPTGGAVHLGVALTSAPVHVDVTP